MINVCACHVGALAKETRDAGQAAGRADRQAAGGREVSAGGLPVPPPTAGPSLTG
jgi:hypothetical protein